jgi:hypothetical protein
MLRMTQSIGSQLMNLDFTWVGDVTLVFSAVACDVAEVSGRKYGVEEINSSMSSVNYKHLN